MARTITAIIPLLGHYQQVQPSIVNLVQCLSTDWSFDDAVLEVVFVGDGEHWSQVVDIAGLRRDHHIRYVAVPQSSTPACLFNRGAQLAKGDFLAFLWPGVDGPQWMKAIAQLARALEDDDFLLAGDADETSSRPGIPGSWLCDPASGTPNQYPAGWVELSDHVPMANCLVKKAPFLNAGGFSSSILLQRSYWWEFTLRYSRAGRIRAMAGIPCAPTVWTWHDYPLTQELMISGDLAARRVMRATLTEGILPNTQVDLHDALEFCDSLNTRTRKWLLGQICGVSAEFDSYVKQHFGLEEARSSEPLRITVLGGPGEPAHNQLCFFNYFGLLERKNKLTWRTVLDTAAHATDLVNSDIVIFSRVKSEEGCRLMDFCVATGIPTIYMLDDNWFTVGKDWPVYASLFSEESPIFKAFTYCLSRANIALTYNQHLVEDMRPYSRTVMLLPTNIKLSEFNPVPKPAGRRKIVGYVGSPRPNDIAFRALAAVARRRDDFDVMYMGAALPECLSEIPSNRLLQESYVFGYRRYAEILSGYAPDVLLAPLGETRFDASKCPNKFLEISAVSAAGIYSNVEPYLSAVEDGKTGLFATSEQTSWEAAIDQLLDDDELRGKIQQDAHRRVREAYATENVLPHFEALLHRASLIRSAKPYGDRQRVAFVSHSPNQAGAERALVNFISNLASSIEPIGVFPLGGGPMEDLVAAGGIPVIRADYDFAVPRTGDEWHIRMEEARFHDYVGRFCRLFRELELDGIVINTNVLQSAVFAAAANKTPVVLHSHGVVSTRLDARLCAKRWSHDDAEQIELASAVVCPSQLVADAYVDLYSASRDKFHVVPNGTYCQPWESIQTGARPHRFSMLCTLEPNKNVPMFLEAAQELKSTDTEIEFHIYGAGSSDYVSYLEKLVGEKELQHHVSFHPRTMNVLEVYDESCAVVVTSQLESFSFVAIEAMSRGRPVISTRCGGPETIIDDGKTGFLVDKNDSAALARAMRLIHRDDELARSLGANARASVEQRFDIKVLAAAYSDLLSGIFSSALPAVLRKTQNEALHYVGTRQSLTWPQTTLSMKTYMTAVSTDNSGRNVEANRLYAIHYANLASALLNGRLGRIRRRLALQDDLWDLVDEQFSEIKRFCSPRHEGGASKLVLSQDLRDSNYLEYVIETTGQFDRVRTAIQVPANGVQGVFGIEVVNERGEIVHQSIVSIADIDARLPIEFPLNKLKGPLGKICRFRFFTRNADSPIWMYELVTRRYAGLKAPARAPFLALL